LTLVEIMVVIAILGLLMSVIAFNVVASADEADVEAAKLQIQTIESNLQKYYATHRSFPDTSAGLETLTDYKGGAPEDPWGNKFVYTCCSGDSDKPYEIVSLGKDGESGGDDANADISSNDQVTED